MGDSRHGDKRGGWGTVTRRNSNLQTLNEINAELIRLADELESYTDKLIEVDTNATKLRAKADYADTEAFLGADGEPMEMRKHLAKKAARDADWGARVAEAEVRHARKKIEDIKERIDSVRSIGANLKAEASIYGSGYGAGS